MIISENWLREWVDFDLDFATLADRLTAAGLEAGALALVPRVSEAVIAARITHLRPHPDAANLSLCEVDSGSGSVIQVVCGAVNDDVFTVAILTYPDGPSISCSIHAAAMQCYIHWVYVLCCCESLFVSWFVLI